MTRSGCELLCEDLFCQVVDSNMCSCGNKQKWTNGVEKNSFHPAVIFPERVLGRLLGQLVHEHRPRRARWCHAGKVVALVVPRH